MKNIKEREPASGIMRMLLAVWDDKMEILARVGFLKQNVARGVISICFFAACTSFSIESQQPPGSSPAPTIRGQSSLALVDVTSQDLKSGLPVRDFKKEDFRVFDKPARRPDCHIGLRGAVRYAAHHSLACSDLQRRRNQWSLGRICGKGIAVSFRT